MSELREKAQPIEVRSRKNAEHWTAQLYLRHISIYFTMLLVRTRISANGVTGLMILAGWCIAVSLLLPGI
ncbi:MAG: CDP-alcohol phosphatidyltransferase family protein, partial [Brevibacterium aurantiacum]